MNVFISNSGYSEFSKIKVIHIFNFFLNIKITIILGSCFHIYILIKESVFAANADFLMPITNYLQIQDISKYEIS